MRGDLGILRKNHMIFTLVDLFCGCGGFTAGFLFPPWTNNVKWRILLGIDRRPDSVATFQANFGKKRAYQADLTELDPSEMLERLGLASGELAHLHASPPCEAYSNNNRVNGNMTDSRFEVALKWARVFLPKVITIENVHNLEKAHDTAIREQLEGAGYSVMSFKLDAADFGVPQRRKRLFYLACLKSISTNLELPSPTHCDPRVKTDSLKPWVTVRDAIGDLPVRGAGDGPGTFESKLDLNNDNALLHLSEYAVIMRPVKDTEITEHFARDLDELALKRLRSLKPGQAIEALPSNLQPKSGFRGAYGRLHPDYPAKTITTGIRGPSHGPFCHYSQERLITFREAARLQSFFDRFVFCGKRSSVAFQIGNAVPPLLSKAIRLISEQLLLSARAKP
ncbi:DNA cytosine methyltransferase [Chloroflexota bacterium]